MSPRAADVWLPEPAGTPIGDWIERAACRGLDPDLWFPGQGDNTSYRKATKVCADCPVRVECLDYAVTNRIRGGIWGGLGERTRRPLIQATPSPRRRPLAAHGVPRRYQAGCRCLECREAHRLQSAQYRDDARRRNGKTLTAAQIALTAR